MTARFDDDATFCSIRTIEPMPGVDAPQATIALTVRRDTRRVVVGRFQVVHAAEQTVAVELAGGALLVEFDAESGALDGIEALRFVTPSEAKDVFDLAAEHGYPLLVSALASLMTVWAQEVAVLQDDSTAEPERELNLRFASRARYRENALATASNW